MMVPLSSKFVISRTFPEALIAGSGSRVLSDLTPNESISCDLDICQFTDDDLYR